MDEKEKKKNYQTKSSSSSCISKPTRSNRPPKLKPKFKLPETAQYFHCCKQEVLTKAEGVQSHVGFQAKIPVRVWVSWPLEERVIKVYQEWKIAMKEGRDQKYSSGKEILTGEIIGQT